MRLIIGADIVPTTSNEELFIAGNASELVGEELLTRIKNSSFSIFNLETPLTDSVKEIEKNGICIKAPKACVNGYVNLGVDFLSLANNHILDYGVEGLKDTIQNLTAHNIVFAGAGKNIYEASNAFVKVIDGERVGIYCCVEHEFSVATETTPGANGFNALEIERHLKLLQEKGDYLIVLYHGGREHYRYPTPELQTRCRKMIDLGADLVICQHSHCIGCEERYNKGTIVYGQGNFIFDADNCEEWQTGLLIEVINRKVNYIPIEKRREVVRMASKDAADAILEQFFQRSKKIQNGDFVKTNFKQYAEMAFYEYMWNICGGSDSIILRILNRLSGYRFYKWYINKRISRNTLVKMLNYFMCESHNEIIIEAIKNNLQG